MTYRRACDEAALWPGEMLGVEIDGVRVLLVGVDDGVRAYRDVCPHNGQRLSLGALRDGRIVCPGHLWAFDAGTGKCDNPTGVRLRPLLVRCSGGAIAVEVGCDDDVSASTLGRGGR